MISSWGAYSAGRFVIGVPVSSRMFPVLLFFAFLCVFSVLVSYNIISSKYNIISFKEQY